MTRDTKKAVRQEAIDGLKKLIKPGDKIYTNFRHATRPTFRSRVEAAYGERELITAQNERSEPCTK